MKKHLFSNLLTLSIAFILFNIVVLFLFRPFIVSFLSNPPTYPFFLDIINIAYPRFIIESKRFNPAFFLEKFDQVIIRLNMVVVTLLIGKYLWQKSTIKTYFSKSFERLGYCTALQIQIVSTLFYLATLYYTYDWYLDLLKLSEVSKLYKPVAFLQPLLNQFPSKIVIHTIGISYYLSLALCFITRNKLSSVVVALLFLLQLGLLQSFEKIDHTYASFTYAILLMPLLLSKKVYWQSIGIAGIRLSIGFCYFFSAVEKVLTGGVSWFSGLSLKIYINTKSNWANLLVENMFLLQISSLFIILFQFFFIFTIITEKGKMTFIISGILFHFLTALILNVGAYDTPWIFMYIFLLNSKTFELHKKINRNKLPEIFFAKR